MSGMADNLINTAKIKWIFPLIFLTLPLTGIFAQQAPPLKLKVVNKPREYRKQIRRDPDKKMIELRTLIPGIAYDIRYATENNFMHRVMYASWPGYTFLRKPAAENLAQVQKELNEKGLGLKIFDAYRPYSVTEKFWELVHDERYVANPAQGSGHNKGTAVDLTIIDLKTGKELDMGTGFDNFTDSAHQTFTDFPDKVLGNRAMFRSIMEKHGFKALETEWWHFYLPNSEKYEVLNLDFRKLKRIR